MRTYSHRELIISSRSDCLKRYSEECKIVRLQQGTTLGGDNAGASRAPAGGAWLAGRLSSALIIFAAYHTVLRHEGGVVPEDSSTVLQQLEELEAALGITAATAIADVAAPSPSPAAAAPPLSFSEEALKADTSVPTELLVEVDVADAVVAEALLIGDEQSAAAWRAAEQRVVAAKEREQVAEARAAAAEARAAAAEQRIAAAQESAAAAEHTPSERDNKILDPQS